MALLYQENNTSFALSRMTQDKTESGAVFARMLIDGAVGFVFGFLFGMLINPPFSGITATSSDVQGLIYFSWFALGVMGGVIGGVVGMIDFRKWEQRKNKEKTIKHKN